MREDMVQVAVGLDRDIRRQAQEGDPGRWYLVGEEQRFTPARVDRRGHFSDDPFPAVMVEPDEVGAWCRDHRDHQPVSHARVRIGSRPHQGGSDAEPTSIGMHPHSPDECHTHGRAPRGPGKAQRADEDCADGLSVGGALDDPGRSQG